MKNIVKGAGRSLLKAWMGAGMAEPFASMFVRECRPLIEGDDPGAPLLLALNPVRFRGDLDILRDRGGFRILRVPFHRWQTRLKGWFYPPAPDYETFANPEPHGRADIVAARAAYRRFLEAFLAAVIERLEVKAVLSAAIHYAQDLDWGAVAHQLGTPYIVLHRENLVTNKAHRQRYLDYSKGLGRFQGTGIVVHNEVARSLFIESGYVEPDRIVSLGCMRMDDFIRGCAAHPVASAPARVVLFSFTHGTGLFGMSSSLDKFKDMWVIDDEPGVGFIELFNSVHAVMARVAKESPETEVVIKTKWGKAWTVKIREAMAAAGYDPDALPNLRITHEEEAHDLIYGSRVVVGFGSTTVGEAGVSGRPVIIPHFAEALLPKFTDYLQFHDDYGLFDVAGSEEQLFRMIMERLARPEVDESRLQGRRELFERYISSIDGRATELYVEHIRRQIGAQTVIES